MSTPAIPADLSTIVLRSGCGTGEAGDACAIQEYRRWCGLDPATDACPEDVCPVLHRLVIRFNDANAAWRAALVPWLPRLTGTQGGRVQARARAFKAADWAVRVFAPLALDAAGRNDDAARLRALAPIVDAASASAAFAVSYAASAASAVSYAASAASAARAASAAFAVSYAASAASAARAASYAAAPMINPIEVLDSILAITRG